VTEFCDLEPGERFEFEGEVWRKLDVETPPYQTPVDNAMMLRLRQTRHFAATDEVTPLRAPSLSFWRKWLLSRALRWQVAGFTSWARWSWKLSRLLATEKTHQALAAHATQLLVMGE
jgi:hypothetical protein